MVPPSKCVIRLLALISALVLTASAARANSTCTSVLTADQLQQLNGMLFFPFSPHLTEADEADGVQGAVKRLTRKEVDALRGAIVHPYRGQVGKPVPQLDAALRTWLRSNSSGQLPAWDSRAADDHAWVPREWVGRTAEALVNLMKANGNVGPMKPSALAAATTKSQELGITRHVALDATGRDVFMWTYIYRATVDGRLITTLLAMCQADIVVMSEDETDLRQIEQQLAKAWPTRDRLTVERVLAREWSVTLPDGAAMSRAALLAATFDRSERIVEAMNTDDDTVTVSRFTDAAIVRGRTVSTVVVSGVRQTNSVRFTHVFIKRAGTWQIVASHLSNVGGQ